jgi:hypothetical protein
MSKLSTRNAGLLLAVLALAGVAYFAEKASAHTSIGGATVPTTFTSTVTIAAGGSASLPIPSAPHDLRLVVAVVPLRADQLKDKDGGVGAVDFILHNRHASWTGIDGKGKVISEINSPLSGGSIIFAANQSGTITLRYGGPITGGHNLTVVNSGATARDVSMRWIH